MTVNDAGGSSATGSVSGYVAIAPYYVNGGAIRVQEGSTYSGSVGTLSDTNPNSSASNFLATFTFNGNTFPVTISGSNGTYSLDASGIGPFDISLDGTQGTVAVTESEQTNTASATISVYDAPITATGENFGVTEGVPWSGEIATFHDDDPNAALIKYSATIDYGDGSSISDATVMTGTGGGWIVTGLPHL